MFGIKSNKVGKSGIYNRAMFIKANGEKMTHREEITFRRKIRRDFLEGCNQILKITNKSEFENLAEDFLKDYQTIFAVNDFTVQSVSESKNTDNLEIFSKALAKVKKYTESKNTKNTAKSTK